MALMKRYGFAPKRIITDKLRSYGAAKADAAHKQFATIGSKLSMLENCGPCCLKSESRWPFSAWAT